MNSSRLISPARGVLIGREFWLVLFGLTFRRALCHACAFPRALAPYFDIFCDRAKVPRQPNDRDCGVYLLHSAETMACKQYCRKAEEKLLADVVQVVAVAALFRVIPVIVLDPVGMPFRFE